MATIKTTVGTTKRKSNKNQHYNTISAQQAMRFNMNYFGRYFKVIIWVFTCIFWDCGRRSGSGSSWTPASSSRTRPDTRQTPALLYTQYIQATGICVLVYYFTKPWLKSLNSLVSPQYTIVGSTKQLQVLCMSHSVPKVASIMPRPHVYKYTKSCTYVYIRAL